MGRERADCGALHATYVAARRGDAARLEDAWRRVEPDDRLDGSVVQQLEQAVEAGDTVTAQRLTRDQLFHDEEEPALDGPVARLLDAVLYAFGYIASFVLFHGADSREAVVGRLRWAYRTVGVRIQDTETVDGVERTTFRCPYRDLGAARWGKRRACHDVLDLVDDGYVDWLARHRDIEYRRPRACTASECCYSEVAER